MAEGWRWVEVDIEIEFERMSSMTTIDATPRALSEGEQQRLAVLQDRLDFLCSGPDQDNLSESDIAEMDQIEEEIAELTDGAFAPEDIARAGAFVSLGQNGKVRIERGYLRP